MSKAQVLFRTLFLGGILPILAFALVENYYGVVGGLIAGVAFGVGELVYEYIRFKKVMWITVVGNLLVIVLGGISLFENDPVFFKLQPALFIFAFAALLLGSSLLKRPFLVEMSRKQRPDLPELAVQRLRGLNWRLGICMIGIGFLSVYAAYYWTTAAWALLKGVGVPVILVVYMALEVLVIRLMAKRRT